MTKKHNENQRYKQNEKKKTLWIGKLFVILKYNVGKFKI